MIPGEGTLIARGATPDGQDGGQLSTRTNAIRVAYVVHGLHAGGIERCVTRLVNDLDRAHVEPMIVCLGQSGPAAEWIEAERAVPIFELHKGSGNDFRVIRRLASVLKEQRVDIVHSHNWGTLLETVVARRRARVPVHVHAERGTVLGQVAHRGFKMRLRGAAARWAFRRADRVVANAHSVAERIQARCGYPAEAIQIIPNGVPCPVVEDPAGTGRERRARCGIDEQDLVIGSIGRLVPVKGFDVAVQAMARLAQKERSHLVLVGDGPERMVLHELARDQGVADRVHLVGHHEDVGPWLAAFDVYLNSSHSEGMSQSICEAMAFGLPIVATDVGDSRLLIGGDEACGSVVPPSQPEALAQALNGLWSPEQRSVLAARARARHQQRFTLHRMIQEYERLYQELLSACAS